VALHEVYISSLLYIIPTWKKTIRLLQYWWTGLNNALLHAHIVHSCHQYWTILLHPIQTTVNNVGSKTLFNPVEQRGLGSFYRVNKVVLKWEAYSAYIKYITCPTNIGEWIYSYLVILIYYLQWCQVWKAWNREITGGCSPGISPQGKVPGISPQIYIPGAKSPEISSPGMSGTVECGTAKPIDISQQNCTNLIK
jgi:hypothetical protein